MEKENKRISKKTLIEIIILLVIIIVIALGVIIFLVNNSYKENKNPISNIGEKQEILKSNSNIYNEIENMLSILNANYYLDFQPNAEQMDEIVDFYNSSSDFNENTLFEFIGQKGWAVRETQAVDYDNLTMPNLVGMNYSDLREYLDNSNLHFITKVNYKYENSLKDEDCLPTTVLSTIPEAGTKLDPYIDTSITVLTEYVYGVKSIVLEEPYKDFELNNFGKTMKVQFGTNEYGIIEGIIGKDFTTTNNGGNKEISIRNKLSWDTVKSKKCACFQKEDMTIDNEHRGTNYYVKGKILIDNKLFKEVTFSYLSGKMSVSTWK